MKTKFTKFLASAALGFGLLTAVSPAPATAQGAPGFIGEMMYWAGNFAPLNFAFCNGQLLPIAQNTALYSLIGTTYGGDGLNTFALPNMQGRALMHPGRGPGLSAYKPGEIGGVAAVTLSEAQIPSHSHLMALKATSGAATSMRPSGGALAEAGAEMYAEGVGSVGETMNSASVVVDPAGGNQAHENRQPYIGLSCIIRLQGIYPPRG
jgi:microcystin-dependent protein